MYALRYQNLCSYTNEEAVVHMIKDGKCDAKCWKDFFNVQYGRTTPCNGDRGTSLMVQEVIKGGDDIR